MGLMRGGRWLVLVGVAVLAVMGALAAGCGGPVGGERAKALSAWLGGQTYSSWEMYREAGGKPEMPPSPDGLSVGSSNVFAVVGSDPKDLSQLEVLYTDRQTFRALAKPISAAVRVRGRGVEGGKEPVGLGSFPKQTLRRVLHTTIAVSESRREDLSVRTVDFAPPGEANNFLCRLFLVENVGKAWRGVDLVLKVAAPGEWSKAEGGGNTSLRGEKLAVVSDRPLKTGEDTLEIRMGSVRPGRTASAVVVLTGSGDRGKLTQDIAAAEAALPNLMGLLEGTKSEWEAWCAEVPISTGQPRMDDLLDSMLCLVRSHVSPEAIHTGSVRYPHDRAWVRDSFWTQWALLHLGRKQEALTNLGFFHRAWQKWGIASYYQVSDLSSTAYGYHGVELPHYSVLMVREAERLGGAEGLKYWDMVKGCLDTAEVPASGLQPMNGDETWLLAAPVRELDDLLDNSWLLIASAEYGADLAKRAGDEQRAKAYGALAARARAAVSRFVPRLGQAGWYASGYGADGTHDLSDCPGVLARAVVLGVEPPTDPYVASGLAVGWDRLGYERGIRTSPRSATVSGGTPGYVLWAAAEGSPVGFERELAQRMLAFASATGCVWEFHDMHDPAWGGEKSRLWDSAVVAAGLVHALCDKNDTATGVEFVPKAGAEEAAGSSPIRRPFDGVALVKQAGPALVLESGSRAEAEHLARELMRQLAAPVAVEAYSEAALGEHSAVIVSRSGPASGWRATAGGYWVREWSGPPQLWVRNTGDVYRDTEGVLVDLLSLIPPQREAPAPFPDASYQLAQRLGDISVGGTAEVEARSMSQRATGRLDLAGGRTALTVGRIELTARAEPDRERQLVKLLVSAGAARMEPTELSVTLPAGWWLLYARDMTGKWDRVRDPVGEYHLPDGRIRLEYSFSASAEALYLTFELTRLKVNAAD